MGVDASPVMILGLTARELGLSVSDLTGQEDNWNEEVYTSLMGVTWQIRLESCYTDLRDDSIYIGIVINGIAGIRDVDIYIKSFADCFGVEPKLYHFTHWH
jgi:hypothetical protein